jgi:hypothetical protein
MSETVVKHSKANLFDYFFANKTRKTYTNIGISLILIIVFLVFALRPTISTVGTIKKKIADYEKYNALAEKKINAAKNLQNQLNLSSAESETGLKEEIAFLDKIYMYNYSLKTIYQNLVVRANQSNVVLRGIIPTYKTTGFTDTAFETLPSAPSLSKFNINVSLEGKDMASVEAFLRTLEGAENLPLISRVSSVSVVDGISAAKLAASQDEKTVTQTVSEPKTITFSLDLIVYLDPSRIPEELLF